MIKNAYECCMKRFSVRNYVPNYKLEEEKLNNILQFTNDVLTSKEENWLNGIEANFSVKHMSFDANIDNIVGNPKDFLGIIGEKDEFSRDVLMKSGYIFQKVILYCTSIGLGTCWFGGRWVTKKGDEYFTKKDKNFDPKKKYMICMSSVGMNSSKTVQNSSIRNKLTKRGRFPRKKLFFEKEFGNPLDFDKICENYQKALDVVRFAPSACNRQKWRVIKEVDKNVFHFFTVNSSNFYTNVDIGIALCNFDVVCKELGVKGRFERINDINMKSFKIHKSGKQGIGQILWGFGMGIYEKYHFKSFKNSSKTLYFMSWIGED